MSVTGSSPRRWRSQLTSVSYQTSPTHRGSKRAFSAAASPRNIGPREKRARRGTDSTSPESSLSATPSKLSDALSAHVPSPLSTLFTNLASSAPATPILPSSSSSFFPAVSSSTSHRSSLMKPSLPPSRHSRATMLDDLHREAFTSLRQSLAHSGEGFLRRMRDWEERRSMKSSKASMLGTQERGRGRGRARRRRASHTDNHTVDGMSESHSRDKICSFPADISHLDRDPGSMSGYRTLLNARDESDIEDNMLIDNVGLSHSLAPSERKPCSGSMTRPPMDIPDSQESCAVELAETDAGRCAAAHYTSTFHFPFTYSNTRSSSPFSFGNTSDDESSCDSRYDQPHSRFSSPCAIYGSVDWSSHTISSRNQSGMLRETVQYSSPATSPRPSSPGLSRRFVTPRHIAIQSLDDTSTHMHPRLAAVSETSNQVPQTASDKALAALVLTLANGSGSLADYGDVREAQGELEEFEAGGLWE